MFTYRSAEIRRLRELTGRDLAQPLDAAEVHVAPECVRLLGRNRSVPPSPTDLVMPVSAETSTRGSSQADGASR
jgi:hypothetical protein